MKKLIALLLVFVLAFSLIACGKTSVDTPDDKQDANADNSDETKNDETKGDDTDSADDPEPCTITWAMNETATLTADKYYAIVDAFMEKYPHITVELDLANGIVDGARVGYETRVASNLQADISLGDSEMQAVEGACAAVPDWLAEKFPSGYHTEQFGAIRRIPAVTQGVWSIIYDKAMFEAAGVTPPETWDEFMTVCQKLKDNGTTPMMLWGGTNQDFLSLGISAWTGKSLEAVDPAYKENLFAGTAKWTDSVMTDRLQKWQDFANSGYIYDGFKSLDYANALTEFYDGKAAMIMEGVWGLAGLDPEKYGIFFVPDNDGNKFTTMTTMYWQVWEEAENVDACWTFIDWLMCGEGLPLYTENILKPDAQVGCSNFATAYEADPLVEAYYTEFYKHNVMASWMEQNVYLPLGFVTAPYLSDIFYNNADIATVTENMQKEYDILMDEQGLRD